MNNKKAQKRLSKVNNLLSGLTFGLYVKKLTEEKKRLEQITNSA